tara:strand:- start:70 stop:1278 length:1209 start_codon:yes stop_codon:yes gene_type:complete
MAKKIIALALLWFSSQGLFSQINFENGYFITNEGVNTKCLIRNIDWKDNPNSFQYKFDGDDSVQEATIYNVQEFKIDNGPKFIRAQIEINRSPNQTSELEQDRKVSFSKEQLFLKELTAGEARLYIFEDKNLIRFFYAMNDMNPEQLVYKKYRNENMQIGENNEYKQQLLNALDCSAINIASIQRLRYKTEPLVRTFNTYNQCVNPEYEIQTKEKLKSKFLLTANVGANFASLSITNGPFAQRSTDFGSNMGFRAGIELESFLPFNKNKWSLIFEPTYQNFKKEGLTNISVLYNNPIQAKVDYTSLEFPLGFRHYFYFNESNSLFVDAAIVFDTDFNSKITFENNTELEIDAWGNWRLGIGYKLKDKIKVQFRYFTPRELLNKYKSWQSEYEVYSIVLGYSF